MGLTGVLPGIFLFRGGMIEFGMLILLLGALLISSVEAVEELRHIRRGMARLIMRVEGGALPHPEAEDAPPSTRDGVEGAVR